LLLLFQKYRRCNTPCRPFRRFTSTTLQIRRATQQYQEQNLGHSHLYIFIHSLMVLSISGTISMPRTERVSRFYILLLFDFLFWTVVLFSQNTWIHRDFVCCVLIK
jgi:hypothetical protein